MKQNYFAIMGDIVNSRLEADRGALQQRFCAALDAINAEFSDIIAADFRVTLGDEFEGLILASEKAAPLFIAERIIAALFPARIRISIGFGEVSTAIRREDIASADGQAFHRARAGLDELKQKQKQPASRILVSSGRADEDETLNTMLLLLCALRQDISERQNMALALYIENLFSNTHKTQSELASLLGITQGTFNTSLTASHAREYSKGLIAAEKLLFALKCGEKADKNAVEVK